MSGSASTLRRSRTATVAVWLGVGACVVYAVFAFDVGASVVLSALGLVDAPSRSAPPLFVVHAFGGGIALVAGSLQLALAPRALARTPRLHRVLGRTYVAAAWVTGAAGLGTAVVFDVGLAGTLAFAAWAALWFATTTAALIAVRRGRIAQHRAWMIRSVALSLVFAVFSVVQPALLGAGFGREVAYPIAVLGSVALVLFCSQIGLAAAPPETWQRHGSDQALRGQWPEPGSPAAVLPGRSALRGCVGCLPCGAGRGNRRAR